MSPSKAENDAGEGLQLLLPPPLQLLEWVEVDGLVVDLAVKSTANKKTNLNISTLKLTSNSNSI